MRDKKAIGTWIAIILLALPIGAAGVGKLMGVDMLHQSFKLMGLPEWFGYFIGLCELSGAIGFHVVFTPLSAGVPALVLALMATTVIFARKNDSVWFSDVNA